MRRDAQFCGEGLPQWAVKVRPTARPFPEPIAPPYPIDNRTGLPRPADCAKHFWADYQFSEASCSAYQNLYADASIRGYFARFWARVASEFRALDNVVAYELLNEPFAGDIYLRPDLMVPGIADRQLLAPFYETLAAAIRAVDPAHCIAFESVTWADLGTGFEAVPGGAAHRNGSILSFHYYFPPNLPTPREQFAVRELDKARLGCATMLTEFDIRSGAETPDRVAPAIEVMNVADEHLTSWIGWDYKSYSGLTGDNNGIFFANGTLNTLLVRALSRTYPMAVCGTAHRFAFNATGAGFELVYALPRTGRIDCGAQPTEIYLNEQLHYATGYRVALAPPDTVAWSRPARNRVVVVPTSRAQLGTVVTVRIVPGAVPGP